MKVIQALGLVLAAFASSASAAPYTFTILDVPGASLTEAIGINNAGQVVGVLGDSSGQHGFINTGGTFTTLDVPGAGLTDANGINNAGQVVGFFSDRSSQHGSHGFVASPVPLPAAVWLLGTHAGWFGVSAPTLRLRP